MLVHSGLEIPKFAEPMDPNDSELFAVVWSGFLEGATISTSEWIIPTNFTATNKLVNVSVTEGTTTYTNACTALISTTEITGTFTITNRVVLSDGRKYDRSFKLKIKEL